MQELVFRDPKKGSVVVRSRQPSLSVEATKGKMYVEGIAFQKNSDVNLAQHFFSSYQDLDFIFIKGKDQPTPPFQFVIRSEKDICLPTSALNDRIFMAQWSSQQWVGELDIVLEDGQGNVLWRVITEVIPPDLPYRKAQLFMVHELESWMQGLSRSLEKPLAASLSKSIPWYQKSKDPNEISENLIRLFLRSLNFLGQNLEEDWDLRHPLSTHSHHFTDSASISLRSKSQMKKKSTKDIPLNRWLLFSLNRLYRYLEEEKYTDLRKRISLFIQNKLRKLALSDHVSVPTYLPLAYQRWYQAYLPLLRRASLPSFASYKASLKDLPQLYEYWAFLKIASMIAQISGAELKKQDLLRFEQGIGTSKLAHGQQLHFSYDLPDGESTIDLFYQKETKTALGKHKPDIWLEIRRAGFETPFIFLMDIKYQVKSKTASNHRLFEASKEAINQLHRYRDALKPQLRKLAEGPLAHKAWGGAVVFPYPEEAADFSSHPQYRQLWEEGIGALPLYPSSYANHDLMAQWLKDMLHMPSEAFFERMINYDKREQLFLAERFEVSLPIPKQKDKAGKEGYWNNTTRVWVADVQTRLFGEGDIPQKSSLGALDAALRYRQLHLLWAPGYLGLRLWQEALKWDAEAHWTAKGLRINMKGVECLLLIEERVQIHLLGHILYLKKDLAPVEIMRSVVRAL